MSWFACKKVVPPVVFWESEDGKYRAIRTPDDLIVERSHYDSLGVHGWKHYFSLKAVLRPTYINIGGYETILYQVLLAASELEVEQIKKGS